MARRGRARLPASTLDVGSRVELKWSDGLWYPAKVKKTGLDDEGTRLVSVLFENRKSIIKGQSRWYSGSDNIIRKVIPTKERYLNDFARLDGSRGRRVGDRLHRGGGCRRRGVQGALEGLDGS